mmetsp:Transcript_8246/g.16786  ORF Transcript_8246/g.16786 Transcript_8246/m.16786 type:complete len:287 (+) Transcript_8246:74-934(+)
MARSREQRLLMSSCCRRKRASAIRLDATSAVVPASDAIVPAPHVLNRSRRQRSRESSLDDTHGDQSGNTKETVLLHLVHSIVNHQGRLDEKWYQTTLQKLDDCDFIPPETAPKDSTKRTYLLYSLFSEVTLVATMIHCLSTTFLVMDQEFPIIPQASPQATSPTWFDWTRVIKAGESPKTKGHFAPFLTASQVNQKNPLVKDCLNVQTKTKLGNIMTSMGPYSAVSWSLLDMQWLFRMIGLLYIESDSFMATFRPLDSTTHCSQFFSRLDAEVIATAVADAYECAY